MRIDKPYTPYQYAELANFCNNNNCRIINQAGYLEAVPIEKPAPTLEEIKKVLLQAVDDWLDATVQERGYESIKTAVSYADEPIVPKFQQEGIVARRWRSLVYQECYRILDDVLDGKREIPSKQQLIAELPQIEW